VSSTVSDRSSTADTRAGRAATVLVTGAGGFLGSAVVRRLVRQEIPVRALAGPIEEEGRLVPPPPGVESVHGDIEDGALLDDVIDGVACVYHLAGPPSVAESFAAPARTLRIHAAATAAVVERCVAAGVPRIVYVSSAEVYRAGGVGRVDESHPRSPRSPYGIAKLAAELVVEAYAGPRLQASIVRPFSVYGPGASPRSLVATLVEAVRAGRTPRVADTRPVRDYCFVDDVADAIVACGGRGGPAARAFNVASGRGVSVAELARTLMRVAGHPDLTIEETGADRPPSAMTLELIGDPERARSELGFSACTSLEDGLASTLRARTLDPVAHP
jgi:nucleoside-diphosphate-sugar epimerase